jgi:Glycosyltransferase 61
MKNNNTIILHYDAVVGRELNWFEKPEDAAALRSLVLDRHQVNSTQNRPRSREQHQTITIINRKGMRRLVNVKNITTALRKAFPKALVQTVYMEGTEPMEQFDFWSQQSIVVAPHGGALTNGIFLPPGNASALIEIFPPHYYYFLFFGSLLVRSCGIRRYGYYNNESDPAADFKKYWTTHERRRFYRNVLLEPPVDDIVGLVQQAVMDGKNNKYTSF